MIKESGAHESGPQKSHPGLDEARTGATLRLFTGIAAPQEINARLDDLVGRLKPLAHIRWSPASNFHITTKFIGWWPRVRLDEVKQALAAVHGGGPIRIAIQGLGFFPNAKAARVFWAGIEGGAPLAGLASRTDEACAKLGIEPEKRPYSPHLTLARIDSPKGLNALRTAVEQLGAAETGSFLASAFHLYLSQPGRGGAVYTPLAEFPL
jgi:2'-5' RNA ligase